MKKRLISFVLMLVMLVSLCSVMPMSASADAQVTTVTVANGDTVLGLCQKLGVDFYTYKELIMKLNGFTSESAFNKISVGSKISLPISNQAAANLAGTVGTTVATGTTAGAASSGLTVGSVSSLPTGDYVAFYLATYTVQKGETLSSIYSSLGASYKTYANQLVKLNNLSSVNAIREGKTLLLPTTNPSIPGASYTTVMAHVMRSGDSAYNIVCSEYGLNYNSVQTMLQALNNRTDMGSFRIGEILYIPVTGVVSATTTVTPGVGSTTTGSVSTSGAYNLVSQTPSNGTFDLQVGGKSAKSATAGQTVTIAATPDTGYAVDTVSVTKVGDSSVSVSVSNNTFVMPSYSVTVGVTFKQSKQSDITVESAKNGGVSVMVDNTTVTKAYAGSKVTVRTTPNAGFMLDHVRVTYNDKRDSIAVENNVFTMPNFGVTVTAVFKVDPDYNPSAGNKIYTEVSNATVTAKIGEKAVDSAKAGDRVTLDVTPKANYTLESIKVYYDNFKKTVTLDKMSFTMPDEPVTVVAVVKPTADATFAINVVENSEGKVKITVDGKEATSAKAGQTVKVEGTSSKDFYYYLTTVTKVGDSSVGLNLGENNTFTMPDYAVDVRVKFYIYHNIVLDSSSNGSYNVISVLNGQTVTRCGAGVELKVNTWGIKDNMSQSDIVLTYTDGSTYTLTDTDKFIMPDCDVRVHVNFTKNTKLVAHSIGDHNKSYTNWGNTYTVLGRTLNDKGNYPVEIFTGRGNTVTVTPSANIGYQLKSMYYLKNTDASTKTEITYNSRTGKYQFELPSVDRVDLYVEFEEMPRYSATLYYGDNLGGSAELYTSLAAADEIAPKSLVWLRVSTKTGYEFGYSKVRILKDEAGKKMSELQDVTKELSFDPVTYRFTMPAYDIIVDLSTAFASNEHNIYYQRITSEDGSNTAKGTIKLTIDNVTYENFTGYDGKMVLIEGSSAKDVKAGTSVIVSHQSEKGYYLDHIEVRGDVSGESIKVTALSETTSYFTMPYESVTIIPIYQDDYFSINAAPAENGSFSVASSAKMSESDPNNLITDIKPADGYRLAKIVMSYTAANGAQVEEEIKPNDKGEYRVLPKSLPKTAVVVSVTFEAKIQEGLQIEYIFDEGINPSTSNVYYVDLAVDGKTQPITRGSVVSGEPDEVDYSATSDIRTGKTVVITRHMENTDTRFDIENIWVTYNGGKDAAYEYTNGQCFFTMPEIAEGKDCTIHVKYKLKEELKYNLEVSIDGAELEVNGTAVESGKVLPVVLGTDVTLKAKAREGFEGTPTLKITVDGTAYSPEMQKIATDDAEIDVYQCIFGSSAYANDKIPAILSAPKSNVKVEISYKEKELPPVTVTFAGDTADYAVYDAEGKHISGDASSVTLKPNTPLTVKLVNDSKLFDTVGIAADYTSEAAPDFAADARETTVLVLKKDCTLTVTTKDKPADPIAPVPMTITLPDGFELALTEGDNITKTESGYTVVPGTDVLVRVTAEEGTDTYDKTLKAEVKFNGEKLEDKYVTDKYSTAEQYIWSFHASEVGKVSKVDVTVTASANRHGIDKQKTGDGVTFQRVNADGSRTNVTKAASGERIVAIAPEGKYIESLTGYYIEKPAEGKTDGTKVEFNYTKTLDYVDISTKKEVWFQLGTMQKEKNVMLTFALADGTPAT